MRHLPLRSVDITAKADAASDDAIVLAGEPRA